MPFVFKFSGWVLFLSFVAGQSWLHADASPAAIKSARAAVAACPKVGQDRSISSQWDVIRVQDAALTLRLSRMVSLGEGCGRR